jgi:N-acetylglutamate synthase-like GNAT family acetyltransferase
VPEEVAATTLPTDRRHLRRLTEAHDPDLSAMAGLLHAVFADPNTVLSLDRLQEFVGETTSDRVFNAVIAREEGEIVGCVVFSYVPKSNCGFSEYIAVASNRRGGGLGRYLFEARRDLLNEQAAASGQPACNGLFIEADNPARVPADLLEQERETAIDAHERLQIFAHLGFKRVDVAYVQPPLGPGKEAVTYLDLLFVPWIGDLQSIDRTWVTDTLQPIWRSWSPETYAAEESMLRARITRPTVRLLPLLKPETS